MASGALASDLAKRQRRRRRFGVGPLFLAFAAQGLVLLGALFVVVIGPVFQSEPDFVAKKTIYLPQRELEHRMAMAEFQASAQPPVMLNKLATQSLVPNSVPPLPSLPQVDFQPVPMTSPIAHAEALLGQSGLLGGLSGVATETSSFSFFGLQEQATKIVIAFDVSLSVKNKVESGGYTMDQVKDAARAVVEQLNPNTLFGFIQFSRQYDAFRPYLVTATQDNKEAALDWLEREFRTDGSSASGWRRDQPNGIQSVIKAIFAMDPAPDVIILLSDASFQRTPATGGSENVPWDELREDIHTFQSVLPRPCRLHFVGFQMRASDKSAISSIVRRYGGRVREVD